MASIEETLSELNKMIVIGCAPMQKVINIVKGKGQERITIRRDPNAVAWDMKDDNNKWDFEQANKIGEESREKLVNDFYLIMLNILKSKNVLEEFQEYIDSTTFPDTTEQKYEWALKAAIWRDLLSEETKIKSVITLDESKDLVGVRQLAEKGEDYEDEMEEIS